MSKGFEQAALPRAEREKLCEYRFREGGPYWHIATPGNVQEILFTGSEDFLFGMNLIAESTFTADVKMLAFALMSNHIHCIVDCESDRISAFMDHFRKRLRRYLTSKGRNVNLIKFDCDPIAITSLQMLRNEIVYVHRNGYVVNPSVTPFTYPWGTGYYYFADRKFGDNIQSFNSIGYDKKREILHSRPIDLPEKYLCYKGLIIPSSFCDICAGERFFRDAHHYFTMLTKNVEAYCEEANRLGDLVVLTDDELFPAVSSFCRRRFNVKFPSDLSERDKVEVARHMRNDFHASNGQIQRMLNLNIEVVDSLYPLSAK